MSKPGSESSSWLGYQTQPFTAQLCPHLGQGREASMQQQPKPRPALFGGPFPQKYAPACVQLTGFCTSPSLGCFGSQRDACPCAAARGFLCFLHYCPKLPIVAFSLEVPPQIPDSLLGRIFSFFQFFF